MNGFDLFLWAGGVFALSGALLVLFLVVWFIVDVLRGKA